MSLGHLPGTFQEHKGAIPVPGQEVGAPGQPAEAGGSHVLTVTPVHPALSLFLMAVNIKTPVVVENITLMCLRILQKLIKPPAPTSKKNKVL